MAPGTDPPTSAAPTTSVGNVPATTITSIVSASSGAASSGLSTDAWLLIGASLFFVALLVALMTFIRRNESPTTTPLDELRRPAVVRADPERGGVGGSLEAMADRLLTHRDRRHAVATSLEVAAINLRPGEFVVLALLGGVVLALLLSTFLDVLGFLLGLVVAPLAARAVVSSRARKRRRAFDQQLPDTLHMMVTLLQSGYGLPQALDAVSAQTDEPTATEFRRVLLEVRIGRDPTDALASTAERMQSRDFAWVVSAININREVGGELGSILDSIAETVRERQRLAREVRVLTAEGRISAWVLTALPILLVVVLSILNPHYFDPMKHAPGPLLVALAVLLLTVGWFWMRSLIKTGAGGR